MIHALYDDMRVSLPLREISLDLQNAAERERNKQWVSLNSPSFIIWIEIIAAETKLRKFAALTFITNLNWGEPRKHTVGIFV